MPFTTIELGQRLNFWVMVQNLNFPPLLLLFQAGVTSRTVHSEEETMQCLKNGAFNRTTASTNMNDQSSRSHAIFTIYLQQQRQAKVENPFHLNNDENGDGVGGENPSQSQTSSGEKDPGDLEQLSAKFHFVDLAGTIWKMHFLPSFVER